MDVKHKHDWEDWIDHNKWSFFKFCTCGGTPKYKYRRAAFELHVLNAKRAWRLFKQGRPFATGAVCETMNTEIDNLIL